MGYDRGDSFPFHFEPNGNSIWLKNCHHDHIPFNVKGEGNIVFSVYVVNAHTKTLTWSSKIAYIITTKKNNVANNKNYANNTELDLLYLT